MGPLLGLSRCEVLPELVADGVDRDLVGGKEIIVTAVTTGVTVGLIPL